MRAKGKSQIQRAERKKIQRRVVLALTELENAFEMYLTMAVELKLVVTEDAEKYLMQYLYTSRLVNDFKSKLEVSDKDKATPRKIAVELAEKTKKILDGKKEVTVEVLKTAIKELNKWPFEGGYVR